VLVGGQAEGARMNFGYLAHASLVKAIGFVLDATVFNEHGEMVISIFALVPAKIVDISIKGVWV
jgi:hypothetical protein